MRIYVLQFALVLSPALALASGTGALNDTGIDFCRNPIGTGNVPITPTTTCPAAEGSQDARYGRDAAAARGELVKIGAGSKGFDFTKIANNGTALPATATLGSNPTDWACTFDNTTGLMWEVKTTSGLRNQAHTYSWLQSSGSYAGGIPDGGSCETPGRCDTEKFVADVNTVGLCGHNDWRLPTVNELFNLADLGIGYPGPTIDVSYFPNTRSWAFWTNSPAVDFPADVWYVTFDFGYDDSTGSEIPFSIRLVRSGR
jgi:hypothetical protein